MRSGAGGRALTLVTLFPPVDGILEKQKRLLTCKTKNKKKERVREGTELTKFFSKANTLLGN